MEEQILSPAQNVAFSTGADRSGTVLLCGPIARPNRPANGGFQSANLRLSRVLESVGFQVRHLYYPDSDGSVLSKVVAYARAFLKIYAGLLTSPQAIVHATPLGRHFIGCELLAFQIARMRGHRLVCDIRAGNQQEEYDARSTFYRMLYRKMLVLADEVSVENEKYLPFVSVLTGGRQAHVVPNFIPAEVVRRRQPGGDAQGPRLAFVGRVNDAKGIPQTVQLIRQLRDTLPDASLVIIGSGDPSYLADLRERTKGDSGIEVMGPLDPAQIFRELDRAQFFVLLSAHAGEGHSNALTEAMARGCVPIATRHGFLEAVIENAGLTFANRDDDVTIARAVANTWRSGLWRELSRRASARVEARYTDGAVRGTILAVYRRLVFVQQAT